MVTMMCCNSTYANVLDTVGHKCALIRPALTTKALVTLCVDCGNEFTDEAWLEHDNSLDCYRESKVKRVVTVISLALVGWLIGALALVGVLAVYDRLANPQEDSGNLLLNCYIYGDGDCGPNGPWHGFVNLFNSHSE